MAGFQVSRNQSGAETTGKVFDYDIAAGSKLTVEVDGFAVSRWWSDWEPRDLCQSGVWKLAKWIEQNRGGFEHNSKSEA